LIYTGLTRARQRLTLWVPSLPVLREACQQRVQRSGGLAE
jgi:ATP-dependent exoDNAse (exonuclease V) alpha subunit